MKILLAVVLTLLLAVPVTAAAAMKVRSYYLNTGDSAIVTGSDSVCTVVRLPQANGFRCNVGADYRGKYGVIINSYEVALIQYTSLKRFKVILRKRQSPVR